jgi:hypothetical protein
LNAPVVIARVGVLDADPDYGALEETVYESTVWPVTGSEEWCGKFERKP